MKTRVLKTREGKLNIYEIKQVTQFVDVLFCSLKTQKDVLEFKRNDSSRPGFMLRCAMLLAHGGKKWKSEGRIESDSPQCDRISFYSFENRKNARVFLVNADAKETWENSFFTVSEEAFRNLIDQLEATVPNEQNEICYA